MAAVHISGYTCATPGKIFSLPDDEYGMDSICQDRGKVANHSTASASRARARARNSSTAAMDAGEEENDSGLEKKPYASLLSSAVKRLSRSHALAVGSEFASSFNHHETPMGRGVAVMKLWMIYNVSAQKHGREQRNRKNDTY